MIRAFLALSFLIWAPKSWGQAELLDQASFATQIPSAVNQDDPNLKFKPDETSASIDMGISPFSIDEMTLPERKSSVTPWTFQSK